MLRLQINARGSLKIFHHLSPKFFPSPAAAPGLGTRCGGWDFPLLAFPQVSGAVAGLGMSGAGGRIPLSDPSPCCFPSAGLFQRLIIYRRLCGQLYRGSYCLIELLDSSAAKTGMRVEIKGSPLCGAARAAGTAPWGKFGFSGGIWGAATFIPPHPLLLTPNSALKEKEAPG